MPERGFYFFEFFCYFFRNFLPRVEYERNLGLKFFSLFLGLFHPVLSTNNAGKRFFNFLIFFLFFWNFLARVEYERNSGLKFSSFFLSLSRPHLYWNSVGMMFFSFLNFLAIFFGNGSPGRYGIRDLNFFLSFPACFNLFWIEVMLELSFLIFKFFCYFFWNFLRRVG